jgi:hypothetical protein
MEIKLQVILFIISYNVLGFFPIFSDDGGKFQKSIILIDKDKVIYTEWVQYQDLFFLRDSNKGIKIESKRIEGVIDKNYYDTILSSNRWKSVSESFYLFSSGSQYQWKGDKLYFREDQATFLLKIVLLSATGYYYLSSVRANQDIRDSYLGFGSDSRIEKFNREYNQFQIFSLLTGLFFGYSAIHSYIRFGTDSNYKDLHLDNRRILPISDLSLKDSNSRNITHLQMGIEFKF